MSNIATQYLYQESRLNLEPSCPNSRILISLPSLNSSLLSRAQAKRTILPDNYFGYDENTFSKTHLALEAGLFCRRRFRYPRNFLWRILDERRVLEIRSVDLSQDKQARNEAVLVVSIRFPSPIKPFGLALAEPQDRDGIDVFVLTTSPDLYTLSLHKDFFSKLSATDVDAEQWCKSYAPSSFGFKQPYRLFARSSLELFLSLHDGSLMRLVRKSGDNGET